jgi:Domain of unknown function (DUF4412)
MKLAKVLCLTTAVIAPAYADFSYTATQKIPGAGMDTTTKHYYKGDKMMTDSGNMSTIIDFDAQTVTHIDRTRKTYTVTKFSDANAETATAGPKMDVEFKETGQRKTINGFDAKQATMTVDADLPQAAAAGGKMRIEVELWLSEDVPGYAEVEAFYKRNMARFPWPAMVPTANPSMRTEMAELQRKMAAMHGVPVLEIMRTKMAGAPAMSAQQQAQMERARAQIEAMQKQGGPQAAAAAQALARMGGMSSGGGTEVTSESSAFSAAPVPDSVFAIPAGFQQAK